MSTGLEIGFAILAVGFAIFIGEILGSSRGDAGFFVMLLGAIWSAIAGGLSYWGG
jgi:hypothetical protein